MRATAFTSFGVTLVTVALLGACTEETENIPYGAVTEVRETQDGRLLVAGYATPDISVLERGFIEFLDQDDSLDDFASRLRAGEIPEKAGLPPVWGVTECEEGEFVAVNGDSAPFATVRGPNWVVESLPESWTLLSVEAAGCDDIIAVGRKDSDADVEERVGVVARFDGKEWSEMELPEDTPPLVGLWRGDLGTFAVGDDGAILSLTDDGWAEMDSPTHTNLRGVWGGSEHVFAVGGSANGEYEVLQSDGEEWSVVASGDGTLLAIHGLADDDVYAVGGASDPGSKTYSSTVLHYDGSEWKTVDSSYRGVFWEVWMLSDGRTIAGGDDSTLLEVSE